MSAAQVLIRNPHVAVDSSGKYIVEGTRVPVRRLWAWHRRGITIEALVRRYPSLGWAKVMDALSFAHDNLDIIETELDEERATPQDKSEGGKP